MTEQTVQVLLHRVASIVANHDEIAKINGDKYNIFDVLGVSTREVRLHSAMIGNLLDVNGSHGCADIFLELFIKRQSEKEQNHEFKKKLNGFQVKDSSVHVEYHAGNINEMDGGRIDLLILDRLGKKIIIENKIFAADQPNQLVRYYNYAEKDAPIFYLTIYGNEPDLKSSGELKNGTDFICISYKDDIAPWLELCLKEAVHHPILRETIKQYINLIKKLTNQTNNHKMASEIINTVVNNGDFVKAAFTLAQQVDGIKRNLFIKLCHELKKEFDSDMQSGFTMDFPENICSNGSMITFKKNDLEYYVAICFVQNNNFHELVIGVLPKDTEKKSVPEEVIRWFDLSRTHFKHIGRYEPWVASEWLIVYRFSKLNDFLGKNDGWADIADGKFAILKEVAKDINDFLKKIAIEPKVLVPKS